MREHDTEKNKDVNSTAPQGPIAEELDASGKSLSEALRISFIVLKVIMIVLVIAFLASGFKTVGSDEQALVLRFGKIRGVGEQRILGPGPHWIFPYPIDEIVKIPTERTVNLPINSFWYRESWSDMLNRQTSIRPEDPLDPLLDGYCLTRSEMQTVVDDADTAQEQVAAGSEGNDYNIVHTMWQLTYQIDDPERFFRNVYVAEAKPGEIYFDVIKQEITPLLTSLFEDAVVSTMVNYTIDDAISSLDRIHIDVETLMEDKLDLIESGIEVVSVQLVSSVCSPQVKAAFEASTLASQQSDKTVTDARTYADQILTETAGPFAEELYESLHDESIDEETREYLWSQLVGTALEKLSDARVYATTVEQSARANAVYLQSLLPEYRQRPELVLQRLYLDYIEQILGNAEEKFFYQKTENADGAEIWVLLNRDATLPPVTGQEQTTEDNR